MFFRKVIYLVCYSWIFYSFLLLSLPFYSFLFLSLPFSSFLFLLPSCFALSLCALPPSLCRCPFLLSGSQLLAVLFCLSSCLCPGFFLFLSFCLAASLCLSALYPLTLPLFVPSPWFPTPCCFVLFLSCRFCPFLPPFASFPSFRVLFVFANPSQLTLLHALRQSRPKPPLNQRLNPTKRQLPHMQHFTNQRQVKLYLYLQPKTANKHPSKPISNPKLSKSYVVVPNPTPLKLKTLMGGVSKPPVPSPKPFSNPQLSNNQHLCTNSVRVTPQIPKQQSNIW